MLQGKCFWGKKNLGKYVHGRTDNLTADPEEAGCRLVARIEFHLEDILERAYADLGPDAIPDREETPLPPHLRGGRHPMRVQRDT